MSKPRNPAQEPETTAGGAQASPEARSGASGLDSRMEAALLAVFRRMAPRGRMRLLRRMRCSRPFGK